MRGRADAIERLAALSARLLGAASAGRVLTGDDVDAARELAEAAAELQAGARPSRGSAAAAPGGLDWNLATGALHGDEHSVAERLRRVVETMSTAFLTLDRNWTFSYVNAAAERILGRRRDELVGRGLWDVYPELAGTKAETAYRRALESGEPVSYEQYDAALDSWFDVCATPSEDGLSVYFHDITDRVLAERDAARLAGERADALAATGAATGRLQILSAASARLAGTLEVAELLGILSDVVLNGFGECLVVTVDERILRDVAGREPAGAGPKYRVAHVAHHAELRQQPLRERLQGVAVDADRFSVGSPWSRRASEVLPVLAELLGDPPTLTLPLVSRGRVLGAMIVVHPAAGALDGRVLIELAARAGVALDNAVLFGAERRLALTLQRSLLPTVLPRLPGIALAARYLPGTEGREVGGDFYIGHPLEDGRLLLVMGDVMGRGAQAAARMGQLRAVLAAYAYDGDPPDRVLGHLSARAPALLDLPMATVLAGVYDPPERVLTFALAGHPPPLVAPLGAPPFYAAAAPGPPLGAGAAEYRRHTLAIAPGATVVAYTDGLIEDRRRPIDHGLELLRCALIDVRLPPEAVCDHVLAALGLTLGAEDDIALLVMNHAP